MKDDHATAGRVLAAAVESALRDLLREIVRDEVRSAVREELAAFGAVAGGAARTSEFLTTEEAATVARVEPATVRDWVRRGDLRRRQAGRELRIRRDELEQFLATGRRSEAERTVEGLAVKILGRGNK